MVVLACAAQSHSVVGILADETDPMVSVMKVSRGARSRAHSCVCCASAAHLERSTTTISAPLPLVSMWQVEKAPLESYADVGGLEQQIQEIKEVRRSLSRAGQGEHGPTAGGRRVRRVASAWTLYARTWVARRRWSCR